MQYVKLLLSMIPNTFIMIMWHHSHDSFWHLHVNTIVKWKFYNQPTNMVPVSTSDKMSYCKIL